jgi:cysteine-rich repeat protein
MEKKIFLFIFLTIVFSNFVISGSQCTKDDLCCTDEENCACYGCGNANQGASCPNNPGESHCSCQNCGGENGGSSGGSSNECIVNSDCGIISCSKTYEEECVMVRSIQGAVSSTNGKLNEYEDYENGILDIVTIKDECQKICNSGTCQSCNVDCSAKIVQTCSIDCGGECSDTNVLNGDGCDSKCIIEKCGNGKIQIDEECDDGNNKNNDGCSSKCLVEYCGDEKVNNNDEECEVGDNCCIDCKIDYTMYKDYYYDGDGDGFGSRIVRFCPDSQSDLFSENFGDCNDINKNINPDITEVCDGIDNNCNGNIDEGCSCIDGQVLECGINIGECKSGKQTCIDGLSGVCEGKIDPTDEICDTKDND